MRLRHALAVFVAIFWPFWPWFLPTTAMAATVRSDVKDARGVTLGAVTLTDTAEGVKVSGTFTNLGPGPHGLHIHAVGKCEPPFESAGGHFNPTGMQHGRDNPRGPHAGDLPNIEMPAGGRATLEIVLKGLSLKGGPNAMMAGAGTSLVLHEKADDYTTDPSGDSGSRIACGVIAD